MLEIYELQKISRLKKNWDLALESKEWMNTAPHRWTGHNPLDQSDLHLAEDSEWQLGHVLIEEECKNDVAVHHAVILWHGYTNSICIHLEQLM